MTIIHRNSDGTIKTFMETDSNTVLGEGEKLEEIGMSFEDFASRLVLSIAGATGVTHIMPVSPDPVTVDIACPGKKNIDLMVNDELVTVKLKDGRGTITLDRDEPRTVSIIPADLKEYCPAGEAMLTAIFGKESTLEDQMLELKSQLAELRAKIK